GKGTGVGARQQGTERVLDALQGQDLAALHPAGVLDGPVTGAQELGRAGRDGPTPRFEAAGEQRVERGVRPQGFLRLLLVQAGGIALAENPPVKPATQSLRGDGQAGQVNTEDGEG